MAANGTADSSAGPELFATSASARSLARSGPRSRYGCELRSADPTSIGAIRLSCSASAAPTSTRMFHRPASRNASSSASRLAARSASNRDRSSSNRRSTLTCPRSSAISASTRSVGSATTSQPKGRPISVVSAASNKVGAADARPDPEASHGEPEPAPAPAEFPAWPDPDGQDWPRQPPRSPGSGGAWRPGHGAQTSRSRSVIRLSPHGTPLAPQGNSSSHRSPRSGRTACRVGSLAGAPYGCSPPGCGCGCVRSA